MAANYSGSGLTTSLLNKKRSKDREFLQEYLLKVIEREKQTEQLSFTMLQSLEDMEQKMNVMSIYLEKIQMLQNHLFTQPTNQPELKRDLHKLQSMSHYFPESANCIQGTQFSHASIHQPTNEYRPDYQTPLNFMQSDFQRIGYDSESHPSYNPTENRIGDSLQTDPKFQNVGYKQILQPNMELTLQLLKHDSTKGLNEKSFLNDPLNAYHVDPVESMLQKERTATITSEQNSIYAALRKNSHPAVADTYAIKKEIGDLQHAMLSLTAQQKDQKNPYCNVDGRYNSNYVPEQTVFVKNRDQATLNHSTKTVMTNAITPHIMQPSKSVSNETDEIYQNGEEKDFKRNEVVLEEFQQSMNGISLEQNQELKNNTLLQTPNEIAINISLPQDSESKIDASINENLLKSKKKKKESIDESVTSILNNKKDSLRDDKVETKVNNNLETQIVNEIETGVINNIERKASHILKIGETNAVEIKIADSIETEIIDQVGNEVTKSGKAETIDKAKYEVVNITKNDTTDREKAETADKTTSKAKTKAVDQEKIKIVNRVKTETADRMRPQMIDKAKIETANKAKIETANKGKTEVVGKAKTEVVDKAKTEIVDKAKTEVVGKAKTEIVDKAKTEEVDNAKVKSADREQMVVVDKKKSETTNGVKELSQVNRKSNVQIESQVLKSSSQSISSKVVSPIDNRKMTKIRRKSKSRKDSILARKSSVLLSGESSESGGSVFNKGLSLTSSAAYKSLIGAAPILPKTQKETTSESASEDDIERAMTMAIRKISADIKEDNSPKKNKQPALKQDTVAERKASTTQLRKTSLYPPATQKMKLTKASRLALGLDSESDSAPVQSSIRKEAQEESDEFDFFS